MKHNEMVKQINILIIGDNGVGKTSILNRFFDDIFIPTTKPTRGISFAEKITVFSAKTVKIRIWNTNGQDILKLSVFKMCENIDGIIITYDVTNVNSFNNVYNWINLIKSHNNINNIKIALVGNKTDISDKRVVSFIEGKKISKKYKIDLFFETSALNNVQSDNNTTIQNVFTNFFDKIMSVNCHNYFMQLKNKTLIKYVNQFRQLTSLTM